MYVWLVEFRVLGPLVVLADDGPEIALGGPKEKSVLALLLATSGQVVDTDRLVEELWAESRPGAGRKTVQAYVSRLRARFVASGHDEVIVARPRGYLVDVDHHSLDSRSFESALVESRHSLSSDPERTAESLKRGLDLWRGRPFEDAHPTPHLDLEAARLEELRLVALETWGEAELAVGYHRELIPEFRRLAAEHPLREGFWRLLMLALYRSGRQSEALRAYAEASRLLREEAGLDPGKDLTDLESRILIQDPALDAPRRTVRSLRGSLRDRLNWKIVSGLGILVVSASGIRCKPFFLLRE
jgi:DNA-binding SARP family transcriptional activator